VPGELGTVPARRALVSSVGGVPLTPGSADTDDLLLWLGVQRPPYRPDSVTVTAHGVLVAFRYTSAPDALVTGATR
jgi:hypothetical protein